MTTLKLLRYEPSLAEEWNRFVAESARNATFLHNRNYMDYHSDRFRDASLVAVDSVSGRWLAALPANEEGNTVWSHHGLTYGGWLLHRRHFNAVNMLDLWDLTIQEWRAQGKERLMYRPVPHLYHTQPSEEDIYGLWRKGGVIDHLQVSSAIDLREPYSVSDSTRRNINLARRHGTQVEEVDAETLWPLLERTLQERHSTKPVHTLAEFKLLQSRFPQNIRVVAARGADGTIQAATALYVAGQVVHSQYIGTTPEGRRAYGLPLLISTIVEKARETGKFWFDFGTSNEAQGSILNEGLHSQKSGLGATSLIYPTYRLDL